MPDKKYFMKSYMKRNFLFILLKITNCSWEPNIWGSPDTCNLGPLMNYGLNHVIGSDRTCLTKKYYKKTNVQRIFYLFTKLKITNCTWKLNIWGSLGTCNLDPLMNYGLKDVIGHASPKNASWKLICIEISFCLKLKITKCTWKPNIWGSPDT